MTETDTIAAVATAFGNSGIGIIRISGSEAISAADRLIELKSKKKLVNCPSHTIHYGFVKNSNSTLDEVMVTLMKAPKSYTREDTVEINCHGGILVIQRILDLIFHNDVRPAEPGEFTKRAFLNGRIDLAQAESVMDVINAQNDFALQASVSQLTGSVSDIVKKLRGDILHEIAFIESAIDDPEHYELINYGEQLLSKTNSILEEINELLINSENGSIIKEGIRTVIVGKPNSGKSSLLNVLSGKERAIVTDIAGTTRDAVEEQIRLNHMSLRVIDTAGIRSTEDIVEKIGVEKAKEHVEKSELAIYVIDASVPLDKDDVKIIEMIKNRNALVLLNKTDLDAVITKEEIQKLLDKTVISVSAKYGKGIDKLKHAIEEMFFYGKIDRNDQVYITNARHKTALTQAQRSLLLVKQSIEANLPEDFYSIDLMDAYEALGRVIGEAVEDDLVNEIFSKFCMGK